MTDADARDLSHLGDFSATPRMLLIAALAVPVGCLSACAAWALLELIGRITNAVFYQRSSSELVAPGAGDNPWWLILLAPVAGGLVIGIIARFGSDKVRGHGMPEAIEAVLLHQSKIQPRVAVLKPAASAVAIGTGGPFGAEGPIIMTGGAIGSLFAQFLHLTADERKTLLVAGSAAGVAAALNTPFAAVLLAVELLLFEWRPRSVIPVAAAVCVATTVRAPLIGDGAMFPSTALFDVSASTHLFCVISGVIAAGLAAAVSALVYLSEYTFERLPMHWMWWPALGGLIIGIGGLFVPEALGVGYNIVAAEVSGSISLGLVVGILIVKTLIWSLSLGSGTSGGVLVPIFMIGGAMGAAESHLFPSVGLGFWALIALVGFATAMLRSPLTGMVFGLELTQRWDVVVPLMTVSMSAFAVSVLVMRRSVLTHKVARAGYQVNREYDVDPLSAVFVSDVMSTQIVEFDHHLLVVDALAQADWPSPEIGRWSQTLYPVVGENQQLLGIVKRCDLWAAREQGTTGAGLMTLVELDPITTHGDQTLRHVAELMALNEITTLPVVDRSTSPRTIGVISLSQLLVGRRRDQYEACVRERPLRLRRTNQGSRPSRRLRR